MTDLLKDLARTPRAILCMSDLTEAGLTPNDVQREWRAGRLVRLGRGAYAVPDRLRTAESRHLLRAQARRRACGAGTVLTHHSAALAYGLPLYHADLATVHLGKPVGGGRWRSPSLVMHALPDGVFAFPDDDLPRVDAAAAVVQSGLINGPRAAIAAADAALRLGLATPDELRAAVAAYRNTPRIGAVRHAVSLADSRAESPGESVLRFDLRVGGYDTDVQPTLAVAGSSYRPDLRVKGTHVLVEFDGLAKYDDPNELRRERTREASLRDSGWELVRFQWHDLENLALICSRVEGALSRTRRPA